MNKRSQATVFRAQKSGKRLLQSGKRFRRGEIRACLPDPAHFRTAWFMESLLTQLLIFFIIRTPQPFFKSRPSRYLLLTGLAALVFSLLLPYLPFASVFELTPLPFYLFLTIITITITYLITAEFTKRLLV